MGDISLEETSMDHACAADQEGDCYSWMDALQGGKIRGDKKRRFSQEQIKSLESMFENQTKLEPRQKLHLAKELGLQPRQVAIWFQNKRARWKSKQLERQYTSLRNDYDALLSSFESLKKEKQLLVKQLQSLSEQLQLPSDRIKREEDDSHNKADANSQPNLVCLKEEPDPKSITSSSDEDRKHNYFSEQEGDLYACHLTSSLTSAATPQFCLQNSWSLENSSVNSLWWEFWPPNE